MSERRKITLAAGILSLATLISRFAGLARDMVIATLFGAGFGSDAFFYGVHHTESVAAFFRRRVTDRGFCADLQSGA